MSRKLAMIVEANRALAERARAPQPAAARVEPGLTAAQRAKMVARLERLEADQEASTHRSIEALDRAEYQANVERKLSLPPGAIDRQRKSDAKQEMSTALVEEILDGVPRFVFASFPNGTSRAEVALHVLALRSAAR